MFELKKKYASKFGFGRHPEDKHKPEFECIWVEGDKAILRKIETSWLLATHSTDKNNFGAYVEVKEPVLEEKNFEIYKDSLGRIYVHAAGYDAIHTTSVLLGKFTAVVTDNVMTDLRIIK